MYTIFAVAGGGGSSSDSSSSSYSTSSSFDNDNDHTSPSSGSSDPVAALFIVTLILVVWVVGVVYQKKKGNSTTSESTEEKSLIGFSNDPVLANRAKSIFLQYQQDWSNFNLASMKTYMTPHYYNHVQLMIAALKLAGRQNQVNDVVVTGIKTQQPDLENKDKSIATISFSATDITNDTRTNTTLFTNKLVSTESYIFYRTSDSFLLAGIDPSTASIDQHNADIQVFAQKNNFYYSLDWGWLLLPQKGQLFGEGKFGVADINNHVIGVYNNVLIQIYTYRPDPVSLGGGKNYIVAQVNIPKYYGGIIVRRKVNALSLPTNIKGMSKLRTEWGDFNDKYEVFATNMEKATSFELLNPKFMEQIEALAFKLNLEVVDNVVYLYTTDETAQYESMLQVLKSVFQEMKM